MIGTGNEKQSGGHCAGGPPIGERIMRRKVWRNRIMINACILLLTAFLFSGPLSASSPRRDEGAFGPPLITLSPGQSPADCRAPSRFPGSIDSANEQLPCRRMKIVQHYLGAMTDFFTLAGEPQLFQPAEPPTDCDEEPAPECDEFAQAMQQQQFTNFCLSAQGLAAETIAELEIEDPDAFARRSPPIPTAGVKP